MDSLMLDKIYPRLSRTGGGIVKFWLSKHNHIRIDSRSNQFKKYLAFLNTGKTPASRKYITAGNIETKQVKTFIENQGLNDEK